MPLGVQDVFDQKHRLCQRMEGMTEIAVYPLFRFLLGLSSLPNAWAQALTRKWGDGEWKPRLAQDMGIVLRE